MQVGTEPQTSALYVVLLAPFIRVQFMFISQLNGIQAFQIQTDDSGVQRRTEAVLDLSPIITKHMHGCALNYSVGKTWGVMFPEML